ncbi:MAG: hypothetical protein IRZ24_10295, partial [Thermogemmatispora sp.]|nr:hypothetical protein [Thermogemmatispora sp.]
TDIDAPWEALDMVPALRRSVGASVDGDASAPSQPQPPQSRAGETAEIN